MSGSDSAEILATGAGLAIALDGSVLVRLDEAIAVDVDGAARDFITDSSVSNSYATQVDGIMFDTSVHAVWTVRQIAAPGVWEFALTLQNRGSGTVSISRMDTFAGRLDAGAWQALSFTSAWGQEFTPVVSTAETGVHLECRAGRSSHGVHPWLGLHRPGAAMIVSPAWSGNWHMDVEDSRVSAGISTWLFSTELAPGENVSAPPVVIAVGASLEDAALALTDAIGRDWIPRSHASDGIPVEWNHWWPYEDVEVSQEIILENAARAAKLGVQVATVDAGWFGDADAGSDWQDQRGDWDRVNTVRFPDGLAALGDGIRRAGTAAGIWIEAEAVGSAARLRTSHPDILAIGEARHGSDGFYNNITVSLDPDDPGFLGYVCLGSAGGRAFVSRMLDDAIARTGATWVKLDFNIDPGNGCTRTDHGHGSSDGLLRHYEGLYRVLDDFRGSHPDVIVEACSSGGLRIDLGLARHVHCVFLSDPDYTEHHLQVLWGASLALPPAAMLHWSWSQWRGDYGPAQRDFGALTIDEFDTMLRAALLQRFGVSLRLPELRPDQLDRLAWHVRLFRETFAPFIRSGTLHRLTPQPLRDGGGERSPAFQLSLSGRHILAAFRLSGGHSSPTLTVVGLAEGTEYRATDLATGADLEIRASELTLDPESLLSASSWIVLVEPVRGG